MSKSVRIRTTPNGKDKYVKVELKQDFDLLEILSLSKSFPKNLIKIPTGTNII